MIVLANYNFLSSEVVLGRSDVILVSAFGSSVDEVQFNLTIDSTLDISFYQLECSEIGKIQYFSNSTREFSITDLNNNKILQYRVDEAYLPVGSTIHYTFTASETSELPPDCAANIHIFTDYSNYYYFILTGQVILEHSSHCLPAGSSVNFTLTAVDSNIYFFVGLKSSMDINYNVMMIRNILEYDITDLSPTNCTFSPASSECSLSLDNFCVLASILQTEYVTLHYTPKSTKVTILKYFILAISFLSSACFIIITILSKKQLNDYFAKIYNNPRMKVTLILIIFLMLISLFQFPIILILAY